MSSETQIFDPNGDVVLILNSHEKVEPTSPVTNQVVSESDETRKTQFNMLVSSKHMILASPVFAAMLRNRFQEGWTLETKGKVEIFLPDDEPDPFTILLNIVHGRTKRSPRRIDLVMMTKLSVLVDKYQMHEVVGVFSEIWMEALKTDIPRVLTVDTLPWLCISWVFGNDVIFKQVTELLMRTGDSKLDEDVINGLPIPEAVIDKIQYERRQGAISNLLQALNSLIENHETSANACLRTDSNNQACNAMVSGSLLKGAQKAQLWPLPEPPYNGFTVDGVRKSIKGIKVWTLCDFSNLYSNSQYGYVAHTNSGNHVGKHAGTQIQVSIANMINSLSDKLCGLSIEDFK